MDCNQGKRLCHVDGQRRVLMAWCTHLYSVMKPDHSLLYKCLSSIDWPHEISTGSDYSEQLISNTVPGFYLFLSQLLNSTLFHNWLLKSQFSPDSNMEPCRPTTHMPQLTRSVMPHKWKGQGQPNRTPFSL